MAPGARIEGTEKATPKRDMREDEGVEMDAAGERRWNQGQREWRGTEASGRMRQGGRHTCAVLTGRIPRLRWG